MTKPEIITLHKYDMKTNCVQDWFKDAYPEKCSKWIELNYLRSLFNSEHPEDVLGSHRIVLKLREVLGDG